MVSVIPRKKALIPRHSEFYDRVNSEARNGRKWHEKISFTKNHAPANMCSVHNVFVQDSFGTEFQEFTSIFVPQNGILSCFLFRGMVRDRTSSVCFYFCSTEWNYELISLPQKGSKQNSEFASIGKEFRAFFSSALFRGTAGIPPEQTNCSAYSNFRSIDL
jgi:hypothetical protein